MPQNSSHAWYSASAVLTKRAPRSLSACNGHGLLLGIAAERRKTSSGSTTQDRRVSTALLVSCRHNSSTGIQVLVCSCLTEAYGVFFGVKIQKRSWAQAVFGRLCCDYRGYAHSVGCKACASFLGKKRSFIQNHDRDVFIMKMVYFVTRVYDFYSILVRDRPPSWLE